MTLLAIAHRAGNSLAGLRTATEVGADVVEADVQEVRGTLEVHHLRGLGPLPLLWGGWRISRRSSPRLSLVGLLAALPASTAVMLDLKTTGPGAGERVAAALHAHAPERPILVCGRHWPAVDSFASLPWARTVLSARTRPELAALRHRLQDEPRGTHYGVSIHRSLLDRPTVSALHEHVELTMTWPVNDPRTLGAVVATGVRGVICDDVAMLRRVIAERAPDRERASGGERAPDRERASGQEGKPSRPDATC